MNEASDGWASVDVGLAASLARLLLLDDEPRVRHSVGVAARAEFLATSVEPDERPLLVVSAWLHDIGYAPQLRVTGFHPLDGARFLRSEGWPAAVCDLVAHHSGSRFVATARGLGALMAEFSFVESPVSDALTIADQTIGPVGEALTLHERMADMLDRKGPDSPNARAHALREPYFRGAAVRVSRRLEAAGVGAELHQIFDRPSGT